MARQCGAVARVGSPDTGPVEGNQADACLLGRARHQQCFRSRGTAAVKSESGTPAAWPTARTPTFWPSRVCILKKTFPDRSSAITRAMLMSSALENMLIKTLAALGRVRFPRQKMSAIQREVCGQTVGIAFVARSRGARAPTHDGRQKASAARRRLKRCYLGCRRSRSLALVITICSFFGKNLAARNLAAMNPPPHRGVTGSDSLLRRSESSGRMRRERH